MDFSGPSSASYRSATIRAVVLSFAVLLLTGCRDGVRPKSNVIRVAAILSQSGRYSAIDVPTANAIRLWIETDSSEDDSVDFRLEDAGSDGIRAVEKLELLWATGAPPQVLVLSTSSIAMALAPHLRDKNVLVVANAGHPDLIRSANDFTFSTFPDLNDECGLFVQRLRSLAAHAVFIVHASDVYHQADAATLKRLFDGRILGEEQYQEGASDFAQIVSAIVRSRAPAVALFGFGLSYPAFQAELVRQGYQGQLLVDTDYLYNSITTYPAALLSRTTLVAPTSLDEPTGFQQHYADRYGRPMPYFAAFIVDGLSLAIEAARLDTSVQAMTAHMLSVQNRPLLSGLVSVGSNRRFSYRLGLYRPSANGFERIASEAR